MRKVALVLISLLSFFSGFTQNDCPSFPKRGSFDSLTFIRSAIPTDPSKSEGIWLGQGTIIRNGSEVRRAFIPDNHPEYALGIVHAWNYHRNLVHRVEKPAIGYWLATVTQETEFICVADAIWSDPNEAPPLYNTANAAYRSTSAANTAASSKGCYQIEGPNGSAWFQLGQNYPSGRFPTSQHDPLAGNFITAAMVKSYYDVYTKEVYQYQKGWDIYEVLDCTADIYAYEIASGSGYNGGINAFASNASWFNGSQNGNNNWQGLAATTANYGGDVAKWISVLENNTTYAKYPAGSSFGGYYTDDITWADVQKYLDQIAIMYPEFDFPTEVTPNAQQAFIKISGSLSTPVPFQEIGPVIDQVILILPREYPQVVEGSPTNTLPSDMVKEWSLYEFTVPTNLELVQLTPGYGFLEAEKYAKVIHPEYEPSFIYTNSGDNGDFVCCLERQAEIAGYYEHSAIDGGENNPPEVLVTSTYTKLFEQGTKVHWDLDLEITDFYYSMMQGHDEGLPSF